MHNWTTRHGLYLLLIVSICSGFFYPLFAYAEKMPVILVFKESASDVDALYFSADGRYIRSAAYGMITKWDLATGEVSRKHLGNDTMSLFVFQEWDPLPIEETRDYWGRITTRRPREIDTRRYRRSSMRTYKFPGKKGSEENP